MSERMRQLGGNLELRGGKNGTIVHAVVPVLTQEEPRTHGAELREIEAETK